MSKYHTTAAYVSGGICGRMWWPQVMGGKPIRDNLQSRIKRFTEPATFQDTLNSLLNEDGGDFQDARFTEDTVIRIERVWVRENGYRNVHVKEIPVAKIDPDFVHEGMLVCDFFGEDD